MNTQLLKTVSVYTVRRRYDKDVISGSCSGVLMAWARWKAAEKEIAKALGGLRRIRVSYRESIGDIIHPYYSIEVKYGKQVPKCCRVRKPTIIFSKEKTYSLVPSCRKTGKYDIVHKMRGLKFLDRAFRQAKRYCPDKTPLVALKPKNYKGYVIVKELRSSL